jgi:hypothetical protein
MNFGHKYTLILQYRDIKIGVFIQYKMKLLTFAR